MMRFWIPMEVMAYFLLYILLCSWMQGGLIEIRFDTWAVAFAVASAAGIICEKISDKGK